MKMNKIMSLLLAVLMLFSSFTVLVGAEGEEVRKFEYRTNSTTSLLAPLSTAGEVDGEQFAYKTGQYELNGTLLPIKTPEKKLELMDYRYGTDTYELYVDAYSGEVAVKNKVTGEILFSNPYSLADSKAAESTKEELLSQLVVYFTNLTNGESEIYQSYTWAAKRNQILVKNIKGGIRVEYSIGRDENKTLVPRQIAVETFTKKIWNPMLTYFGVDPTQYPDPTKLETYEDDWDYNTQFFPIAQLMAYFILIDPNNPKSAPTQSIKLSYLEKYPVTEEFPIYILDTGLEEAELRKVEGYVKTYCPDYSFDDLEADHAEAKYEAKNESFPLFKMAIEYTLDEDGLVARLPANGIRFDETLYRLESLDILPYMGAGVKTNPGYVFFPDGSGTLFEFDDLAVYGTPQSVTGKIYGQDYAYHEVSGKMEQILRYPVFGIVENKTENGISRNCGFAAIVEEGDSLMELNVYHAGQLSEYNTVKMKVYPRPTDTFNMADAISVAGNAEWTVVSDRKYTGSYQIRYVMLTDEKVAAEKQMSDYYDASYVGMAKAYRTYLEENGVLTRLTAEDVAADIPLYIETFGAMLTTEKILSIPVDVMTPLTSFSDIATMYDELEAEGIKNVNFILTGYTKGGLEAEQVPYNLKWENAVEKDMNFEELLEDARNSGYGVFPDFDFVFASEDKMFDGFSMKKHAAKTIDNRYTSKREYSATKHTYVSYFEMAISPAYFNHFYEKFIPKYEEYNPMGISVSTLGSYLNSDFDEDEPFNRADGQRFTAEAFEYIKNAFADRDVLSSGGNAYTWKYVDHLTDVALDSSRYTVSSAAVPFLGMVLHGYVEIAGTPINMEGNLEYAFLKALESGAGLNFVLSYRNTDNLKDNESTSQYYSVRYDIWFNDVSAMYQELNALLKGVQTSVIVDHKFVDGMRVPDADELEADARAAVEAAILYEESLKIAEENATRQKYLNARLAVVRGANAINVAFDPDDSASLIAKKAELDRQYTIFATAAGNNRETPARKTLEEKIYPLVTEMLTSINELKAMYQAAVDGMEILQGSGAFDEQIIEDLQAEIDALVALDVLDLLDAKYEEAELVATTAYADATVAFPNSKFTEWNFVVPEDSDDDLINPNPSGTATTGSKYDSDDNMIVYVAYENGTEFLLNFNDYRVVVKLDRDGDGVEESTFAIDAYGYVVLNRGF